VLNSVLKVSSWAIILRSYVYERDVLLTTEKNVIMQQFDVADAWVCISASTFARTILSLGSSSAYFMKRSEVFLIRHSYSLTEWHHIPKRYNIASEVLKKYGLRDISSNSGRTDPIRWQNNNFDIHKLINSTSNKGGFPHQCKDPPALPIHKKADKPTYSN
jgi:hypothetical protein